MRSLLRGPGVVIHDPSFISLNSYSSSSSSPASHLSFLSPRPVPSQVGPRFGRPHPGYCPGQRRSTWAAAPRASSDQRPPRPDGDVTATSADLWKVTADWFSWENLYRKPWLSPSNIAVSCIFVLPILQGKT